MHPPALVARLCLALLCLSQLNLAHAVPTSSGKWDSGNGTDLFFWLVRRLENKSVPFSGGDVSGT